jgi:hypothetical protein
MLRIKRNPAHDGDSQLVDAVSDVLYVNIMAALINAALTFC